MSWKQMGTSDNVYYMAAVSRFALEAYSYEGRWYGRIWWVDPGELEPNLEGAPLHRGPDDGGDSKEAAQTWCMDTVSGLCSGALAALARLRAAEDAPH